ncbi:hypothetical protein [Fundidesulfovibrio agrisoli]|uniref:hypothetical protein n=1 Tax=Fundidesulfovibrio agrisoli TaxID=2922717 RepID=UPI001FADC6C9|nr:hypothetical protein [Fundidesulfovibrio agrisoli]
MADINITAPIVQMPNLQGMAAAQLAHPEVQQVFAQQMALQIQKDQQHQVQKVEKQESAVMVKDEDSSRQSAQHQQQPRRQRHPDEGEDAPPSSSPWIGHLLDKKV